MYSIDRTSFIGAWLTNHVTLNVYLIEQVFAHFSDVWTFRFGFHLDFPFIGRCTKLVLTCPQHLPNVKCSLKYQRKKTARGSWMVFRIHNTWSKKKCYRVHSQSFGNRDSKLMIHIKWYAQSDKWHSVFMFGWGF